MNINLTSIFHTLICVEQQQPDLTVITKITTDSHYSKVDVQNNILHTLREASNVGEKAIFHFSFPPPHPRAFSASNISKKILVGELVLTKPRGLI